MTITEVKQIENIIEWMCSEIQTKQSVECFYFAGYKQESYHLPNPFGENRSRQWWYCEIWFNQICVFREVVEHKNLRDTCLKRLVYKFFLFGITEAKQQLERLSHF
jgi:hypothetical protein